MKPHGSGQWSSPLIPETAAKNDDQVDHSADAKDTGSQQIKNSCPGLSNIKPMDAQSTQEQAQEKSRPFLFEGEAESCRPICIRIGVRIDHVDGRLCCIGLLGLLRPVFLRSRSAIWANDRFLCVLHPSQQLPVLFLIMKDEITSCQKAKIPASFRKKLTGIVSVQHFRCMSSVLSKCSKLGKIPQ